ncbi:MAG: VOC family protein [Gammaproteobacteria bacterium]|nr:VOC family protein [Gammaproteobacteria bacterium]
MHKPAPHAGLRHVALYVKNLETCVDFYTRLLGMTIDWQPDPDNVYLTSGCDNFALHRAPKNFTVSGDQHLDHIGFFLTNRREVDDWYHWLDAAKVEMKAAPRDHRDGTRSFYCADPDGNIIQMIYVPNQPKITSK